MKKQTHYHESLSLLRKLSDEHAGLTAKKFEQIAWENYPYKFKQQGLDYYDSFVRALKKVLSEYKPQDKNQMKLF